MHKLHHLFYPRNIAILGASADPSRPGYSFMDTLVKAGYQGNIFPINPKGGELFGYPFFRDIEDIGEEIDVILNLLSAKNSVQVMNSVANCKVNFIVLFTSGFAEMGNEGLVLQKELIAAAKELGVRVVGPNCMGIANIDFGVNITSMKRIPHGPIGYISQSGNVGITSGHHAKMYDTGFSKLVFFGNQADIDVHEYLEFFGQDENTKVIAMYLEGLRPGLGNAFVETAKRVSTQKPIVLIKGGRTLNAVRAAVSHTASMAGEAKVFSSVFKQSGIIEVENVEDLIPAAETLFRCPVCKGRKIAVVGSGGGHSILMTDSLELNGFDVPPLSNETRRKVAEKLPLYAPIGNPVDMTGVYHKDLRLFADLTRLALDDPVGFEGVINYGAYDMLLDDSKSFRDPQGLSFEEGLALVGELQRETGKPIIAYSPNAAEQKCTFTLQRQSGVPAYDSIERAVKCMDVLYRRNQLLNELDSGEMPSFCVSKEAKAFFEKGRKRENRNLTESEVLSFMKINEVEVLPYALTKNCDEAQEAAEKLGYPVVMKIVSPDVIHKSDAGGVVTNIKDSEEVKAAFNKIIDSVKEQVKEPKIDGVLLTPFVRGGIEMIVGVVRDLFFGPMLMVGFGGIYTEFFSDVEFIALPATEKEILTAIKRLKSFILLEGFRGSKPCDIESFVKLLHQLGRIALAHPDISEMDLNPVLVSSEGTVILDARIIVGERRVCN